MQSNLDPDESPSNSASHLDASLTNLPNVKWICWVLDSHHRPTNWMNKPYTFPKCFVWSIYYEYSYVFIQIRRFYNDWIRKKFERRILRKRGLTRTGTACDKNTSKPGNSGNDHNKNRDRPKQNSLSHITMKSIEFSFRKSIPDRILAKSKDHNSTMT